jgi:hypothetical protein
VRNIDGMILVGESRRTGRITCFSATLFTTNPTLTGLIRPLVMSVLKCGRARKMFPLKYCFRSKLCSRFLYREGGHVAIDITAKRNGKNFVTATADHGIPSLSMGVGSEVLSDAPFLSFDIICFPVVKNLLNEETILQKTKLYFMHLL